MRNVYAVYFSPTGSTGKLVRTAAKAAAESLRAEYKEIDFTLPKAREAEIKFTEEDMVILGTPTYAGRVPNKIMPFIRDAINGDNVNAAVMVTYGNRSYDESLKELTLLMKGNGFKVAGAAAFVCEHAFAGKLAAGRPDENDLNTAREFGRSLATKGESEITIPGEAEGVGPYYVPKKEDGTPAVFLKAKPVTDENKCTHCGRCEDVCPVKRSNICIKCQACIKSCPKGARYFDNEDFLRHKQMLENNFTDAVREVEIYI